MVDISDNSFSPSSEQARLAERIHAFERANTADVTLVLNDAAVPAARRLIQAGMTLGLPATAVVRLQAAIARHEYDASLPRRLRGRW